MAEIYDRVSTSDKILILETRESATQPFQAPNWTDLRIGMILSITDKTLPDTQPPAETFAAQVPFNPGDWMWIGLKDSSPDLPGRLQTPFIGFTNACFTNTATDSILQASDLGYGTGTYYWVTTNSRTQTPFAMMVGAGHLLSDNTIAPHFFQARDPANPAPADYYCGMIGFRLTRANGLSTNVTAEVAHMGAHSSDMFWTDAPTQTNLLAKMDPWPTTVATVGPVNFGLLPNCLFCYWPFHNSRLRVSIWAVYRAA